MNRLSQFSFATALLLPVAAFSQVLTSGPQLKEACEAAVGNVVQITQPTFIEYGPGSAVNTPCTLQIASGASFSVKQVNMSFAGPLTITGVYQGKIGFEESVWTATSVQLSAIHYGEIVAKKSGFRATTGDVLVSLSHYGKLEMIGPVAGNANMLDAAGEVMVTTGINGSAVLEEAHVRAGTNLQVRAASMTPMKLGKSNLTAETGYLGVTAGSNLEISGGSYSAAAGVALGGGASSIASVKDISVAGGSGNVSITAGASGKVELNQSNLSSAANVTVGVGAAGQTLVDNVQLDGATGVLVQSGAGFNALTLLKNSRGTSAGSVIVRSGGGGVCQAESNYFTAPVIQTCN